MSSNSISWTYFCQGMNSIAYWLLQNKKKYKKRDYYQMLKLKSSCKGGGVKRMSKSEKVG